MRPAPLSAPAYPAYTVGPGTAFASVLAILLLMVGVYYCFRVKREEHALAITVCAFVGSAAFFALALVFYYNVSTP